MMDIWSNNKQFNNFLLFNSGGAELLFDKKKKHEVQLAGNDCEFTVEMIHFNLLIKFLFDYRVIEEIADLDKG